MMIGSTFSTTDLSRIASWCIIIVDCLYERRQLLVPRCWISGVLTLSDTPWSHGYTKIQLIFLSHILYQLDALLSWNHLNNIALLTAFINLLLSLDEVVTVINVLGQPLHECW